MVQVLTPLHESGKTATGCLLQGDIASKGLKGTVDESEETVAVERGEGGEREEEEIAQGTE